MDLAKLGWQNHRILLDAAITCIYTCLPRRFIVAQTSAQIVDEITSECVGARVRILARAISAIYDDQLRPHGVRFSQMNILVTTAKLGTARQADICRVLQMDHSTVSRNVERMCVSGWLERLADNDDARVSPFAITSSGTRLIRKAYPAWRQAQNSIVTLLGQDNTESLKSSVGRIRSRETTS